MKIREITKKNPDDYGFDFMFFCPACQCGHGIRTKGPKIPGGYWTFNGNMESPTINPSIKVSSGPDGKNVCHSTVNNGQITFCNDSTHALAGKTVPLEDF